MRRKEIRGKSHEPAKALDEELLGQRLPVMNWMREPLLDDLRNWLADSKKGRQWIWEHRAILPAQAVMINGQRSELLAKRRKIRFADPEG
jgi:hypothetical protein